MLELFAELHLFVVVDFLGLVFVLLENVRLSRLSFLVSTPDCLSFNLKFMLLPGTVMGTLGK